MKSEVSCDSLWPSIILMELESEIEIIWNLNFWYLGASFKVESPSYSTHMRRLTTLTNTDFRDSIARCVAQVLCSHNFPAQIGIHCHPSHPDRDSPENYSPWMPKSPYCCGNIRHAALGSKVSVKFEIWMAQECWGLEIHLQFKKKKRPIMLGIRWAEG
jgi:hypothetical protein